VQIRPGSAADLNFPEETLFEAFFWDVAMTHPPLTEFRKYPEFAKLLAGWGRVGDRMLVAEDQEQMLGAAWFRLWPLELHSYGFIDGNTPELAIAVASPHRGKAIGRRLLETLIATARGQVSSSQRQSLESRKTPVTKCSAFRRWAKAEHLGHFDCHLASRTTSV
jgi:GNAT superfamily N-acetyltransferase